MAKLVTKVIAGIAMIVLGGILFSANTSRTSSVARATNPDIHSDWTATKLFVIQTNTTPGVGIYTGKTEFAIGVAGWHVALKQNINGVMTDKYTEDWSLPSMPNCYADPASCSPGGTNAGSWLWSYAHENGTDCQESTWTFNTANPTDAALYVTNPASNRAGGPGGISSTAGDDINQLFTLGAYGWVHGRVANSDRGGIVCGGSMIPLTWSVDGHLL